MNRSERKRQQALLAATPNGRLISRWEAVQAARRLRTTYDGGRQVERFSFAQRVEHFVLMVSMVVLAVTGLVQSYYSSSFGVWLLKATGGIDSVRQVHRAFVFVLAALVIYHVGRFLDRLFVHAQVSRMAFERQDLRDLVQMLKLDLGLTKTAPRFDRYNFEQKVDYWALAIGLGVTGVSGLIQMFPLFFTGFVPGWVIPAARSVHHWQAILIVAGVATWHLYHTVVKKFNRSIFGGTLSVEEMQAEHPLEMIYLERAAAVVNNAEWPAIIDLSDPEQKLPEREAKPPVEAAPMAEAEPAGELAVPAGGENAA